MFKKLKGYVKSNPLTTATYAIGGTSAGMTLFDVISSGKIDTGDILVLGLVGIATIGAKHLQKHKKILYDYIDQRIEKDGFTPEILKYKENRKVAKKFANKNNRTDEYESALKYHRI